MDNSGCCNGVVLLSVIPHLIVQNEGKMAIDGE